MTRTPIRFAGRAAVAGIALTAMGILAASPAIAAVPALYTYLDGTNPYGYSTMSATTGAVTPLPTLPTNPPDEVVGEELTNGVGTAIGVFSGDPSEFFIYDWNATTGASNAGVPAFVAGADEGSLVISGLDTRNDGTLITYAEYTTTGGGEFPTTSHHSVIATVNRDTGELLPVIGLDDLYDSDYIVNSLATDPLTGISYVFMEQEGNNLAFWVELDFDTQTFDIPGTFDGAGFESGFFQGADFDASGTLWFIYGNNDREMYELSTLGSPATWATDARTVVADAASNYAPYPLSELALTTAPAPALAETGAEFPVALLALGSVAVIAGVVTVVTVSRRRRAA